MNITNCKPVGTKKDKSRKKGIMAATKQEANAIRTNWVSITGAKANQYTLGLCPRKTTNDNRIIITGICFKVVWATLARGKNAGLVLTVLKTLSPVRMLLLLTVTPFMNHIQGIRPVSKNVRKSPSPLFRSIPKTIKNTPICNSGSIIHQP